MGALFIVVHLASSSCLSLAFLFAAVRPAREGAAFTPPLCSTPSAPPIVANPPITMPVLAEFVGTFIFLGGILSACKSGESATLKLSIGLAIAASIIGQCSGGHMNPAVTVMLLMKGDFTGMHNGVLYIIAQLLGGVAALQMYKVFYGSDSKGDDKDMMKSGMAELVGTFVFFSGILASGGDVWKVGFSLYVAANLVGDISGGHLNPAVTAMMLLKGEFQKPQLAGVYILMQMLGGLLALAVHNQFV